MKKKLQQKIGYSELIASPKIQHKTKEIGKIGRMGGSLNKEKVLIEVLIVELN